MATRWRSWLGGAALVGVAALGLGWDCGGHGDCVYAGMQYASGATFPSSDGCNSCSCSDGMVACTARACVPEWYRSCGDPVCRTDGHVATDMPPCTTEQAGTPCTSVGATCDPDDECNVHLVCATSDPTKGPGGCPISLARYKRDIVYLTDAERARLEDELLRVRLATWRYKADGDAGARHLGFIIDDVGASPAVSADGRTVDLYGYTSLAVATVQVQAAEIARLRAEVKALERRVDALASPRPHRR